MKRLMVAVMVVGLVPALGFAQEKGKVSTGGIMGPVAPTKPKTLTPPALGNNGSQVGGAVKSFSQKNWRVEIDVGNNFGHGGRGNDDQNSRWDDRVDSKVNRLERKVERLEEVVDYLLYLNERGGSRHEEFLYRCSMSVCFENNAFFCDSRDFRSEVAVGTDRARLFEELKRRGSAVYTDTFRCSEL